MCAMIISLEGWKCGRLHILCDDDTFGSLEVYELCAMTISLEVCELTYCMW